MSSTVVAQDDTEEETTAAEIHKKEEIEKERQYLTFKAYFIEAVQQRSIENYDRALESLTKCESIYPENVAMFFEKAKNHFALNQFIEAHHYCDKALVLEPDNFWILALSRDIYEKEYNYIEAIHIQKKLFEMKKSEAENLLKLYYRTKNEVAGQELLAEIEKKYIYVLNFDFYDKHFNQNDDTIDTSEPVTNRNLEMGSLSDLKIIFAKQKDYKTLEKILEIEFDNQQFTDILSDSEMGLSLYPAQAKLYLYNGIALNKFSKSNEAITVLESGLDFVFDNKPLTKQFYNALIEAYTTTKNTNKVNYYKQLAQQL